MIPRRSTAKLDLLKINSTGLKPQRDYVAVEEPLEIRLNYEDACGQRAEQNISITMRTPGEDFELAAGFLYSERIIQSPGQVEQISYCVGAKKDKQHYNIVTVALKSGVVFDSDRLLRHFYTTSSCGVCGKASLEAISTQGCQRLSEGLAIAPEQLFAFPERLRNAQAVFEKTGGLHAAALFDARGNLVSLHEDVGRHNAVDKLIGAQLLANNLPLDEFIMLVSGRAGFEIIQKALTARIPIVASVGAPSSLAVDLAREFKMTLIGFLRGETFNIYSAKQRIISPSPVVSVVIFASELGESFSDRLSRFS